MAYYAPARTRSRPGVSVLLLVYLVASGIWAGRPQAAEAGGRGLNQLARIQEVFGRVNLSLQGAFEFGTVDPR